MNERLKALMLEAGYAAPELAGRAIILSDLIVKECLLQIADIRIENDFEPVADAALVKALVSIKTYFGVEK